MSMRERKEFIKQIKKHTLTQRFQEDDSVMLDIDKTTSRKTYKKTAENYKAFVEASKGVVFTVHVNYDCFCLIGGESLISLKENPEWLFWSGDLVKVEKTSGDQTTTENNTVTDSEN